MAAPLMAAPLMAAPFPALFLQVQRLNDESFTETRYLYHVLGERIPSDHLASMQAVAAKHCV